MVADSPEQDTFVLLGVSPFLGDERRPRVRNRRLSDSALSVKTKEDVVSLMKLTQLENKVQLLKERVEILEKEITKPPLELRETGRLPVEQGKETVISKYVCIFDQKEIAVSTKPCFSLSRLISSLVKKNDTRKRLP